ncbi:helix-turn-helix domain-containing protein [Alicyclobacillus ferrooxydans]|uniref:helix-turn-helix domain-containing protein n=1 Tax=Alicyclobacillus ferrooxydans TaxID=471514 RepID=UPI0009FAFB1E|nr:helix-turn-helix transcriptional regulator [Alicyclobacillus ferrooxydans]
MTLGERLTQIRTAKQLTTQQVADELGIARSTYTGYETEYREPDTKTLIRLAELYEVSLDWLLTGKSGDDMPTLAPEEREFLTWVKNHLTGTFFYDFSKSPTTRKKEMMRGLRIIYELEKGRKPGQKQGE